MLSRSVHKILGIVEKVRDGSYCLVQVTRRKKVRPHRVRFTIQNDTYPITYIVQIGGKSDDLIAAFARTLGVAPWSAGDDTSRFGHFTTLSNYPGGAIWLDAAAKPEHVAHEALHAVAHSLRNLGMPLGEDSEEAYTYLQQWLIERIHAKLPRAKAKR